MTALISAFVLMTVAEFRAKYGETFFASNGAYRLYAVKLDSAGKVETVVEGHQHYTAAADNNTFRKTYAFTPHTIEELVAWKAETGKTQNIDWSRMYFDPTTGIGEGTWLVRWCDAPAVGADLPEYKLPVAVKSTKVAATTVRPVDEHGFAFVKPSRRNTPAVVEPAAPVYEREPATPVEVATFKLTPIADGDTQANRDAAAGIDRRTAAQRRRDERMNAAELAADKRNDPK